MRLLTLLLFALNCFSLTAMETAHAANKKPSIPSPPRPIYEAPMRVVIVRNSSPVCEPTCPQWIAAEGEIMDSTPEVFRRVFQQMEGTKLPIVIRSPGGSINAAIKIGRMIRERKLTVAVGHTEFRGCSPADQDCKLSKESKNVYEGTIFESYSFCNSACPILLSGGTTRLISSWSSAGVHQPKTIWTRQYVRYRDDYQIINGKRKITNRKIISRKNVYDKTTYGLYRELRKSLTSYYKSMGIDLAILEESEKAKYKDINTLTTKQIDDFSLRTVPLQSIYLAAPSQCGTLPTSAVCVFDKMRDPTIVLEQLKQAAGITSKAPEMTFRPAKLTGVDCQTTCPVWIAAQGLITVQTPDRFKSFIERTKIKHLTVVLHSEGGDLLAAIALGQAIRLANLDTAIGQSIFEMASNMLPTNEWIPNAAEFKSEGLCQGVCILAFTGGKNRHVSTNSRIILHNPAVYRNIVGGSPAIVEMNQYLQKMGVDPGFMKSLYDIKESKPRSLQRSELTKYAVINAVNDGTEIYSPYHCKLNRQSRGCFYSATVALEPDKKSGPTKTMPIMKPILAMMPQALCAKQCPVWIYGEGRINSATVEDFKKIFSETKMKKLPVILNSENSDLYASFALGELLRENAAEVAIAKLELQLCENCGLKLGSYSVVPATITETGQCDSSCVIALAGGSKRMSFSAAPLYVQSIETFKIANVQEWKLRSYFDKMGMKPALMELIKGVENGKSQSIIGQSQLLLGLINSDKRPTWLARNGVCANASSCINH
jgi:hypothetical protein